MAFSALQVLLVLALSLTSDVFSLPYRTFSPRSVPGRIRSSADADNFKEYLSKYLEMVQQQQLLQDQQLQQQQQQQQEQQQQQQRHVPYPLPEYEPVYQQGYISRRPQISPETLAAMMPYLSETELGDFSYDYPNAAVPSPSYADEEEGAWYDDSNPRAQFESSLASSARDKNNQEAAMLRLFIDNLTGKYSLEDLETLERQAAIEDNTENQLQALMPRKKSSYSLLGARASSPMKMLRFPERKGQKEEPIMVPASSIRKPVFVRASAVKSSAAPSTALPPSPSDQVELDLQNTKKQSSSSSSPSSSSSTSASSSPSSSSHTAAANQPQPQPHSTASPASSSAAPTTMEPAVKSAYEAFMSYLDQERFLRKTADEARQQQGHHSPQKRFVSEPESLTQQLASLKKTIT